VGKQWEFQELWQIIHQGLVLLVRYQCNKGKKMKMTVVMVDNKTRAGSFCVELVQQM
jgi:hypothetical protein